MHLHSHDHVDLAEYRAWVKRCLKVIKRDLDTMPAQVGADAHIVSCHADGTLTGTCAEYIATRHDRWARDLLATSVEA